MFLFANKHRFGLEPSLALLVSVPVTFLLIAPAALSDQMFQFNVDRSTEYPAGMKKLQVVDGKVRSVEKNEPAVDGAA
ncbi:MAG TPA: hypothetical protein V6C72_01940, partial [Chroococcales cyanobacterium]